MIRLKRLLIEKTLYHGTTIDNAKQIEKHGLVPQAGDFVSHAYDAAELELPELVFAAEKKALDSAVTAATQHIANKLKKDFHDVTDEEFARHAAILKIYDGEEYFKHKSDKKNDYTDYPGTVETGDYYTDDVILPDEILTGAGMLKLLKRYRLWPRNYMFSNSEESAKQKRNVLIKYLIKKYPDREKRDMITYVMKMDKETVEKNFSKIQYDKS